MQKVCDGRLSMVVSVLKAKESLAGWLAAKELAVEVLYKQCERCLIALLQPLRWCKSQACIQKQGDANHTFMTWHIVKQKQP